MYVSQNVFLELMFTYIFKNPPKNQKNDVCEILVDINKFHMFYNPSKKNIIYE